MRRQASIDIASFADPVVAAVVAETMQGYPLGGRVLVCHTVDPEKLHEKTFAGKDGDVAAKVAIPWRTIARKQQASAGHAPAAYACLDALPPLSSRRLPRLLTRWPPAARASCVARLRR